MNLIEYCLESYKKHNIVLIDDEFREDFFRFTHIHKNIKRYVANEPTDVKQILNNIIISYNVFGQDATKILIGQIPDKYKPQLKSFLLYLHKIPNIVLLEDWEGNYVNIALIDEDQSILAELKKI